MTGPACKLDVDGFCVFALLGNPRCFRGRGEKPCLETSSAEALRHTKDAILRREEAAMRGTERRAEQ